MEKIIPFNKDNAWQIQIQRTYILSQCIAMQLAWNISHDHTRTFRMD